MRLRLWLRAFLLRLYERLCPPVPAVEIAEQARTFAHKHAAPGWTDADGAKERELYLANRTAFWLRPDRHEHGVPCWMVEGEWEEPRPVALLTTTKGTRLDTDLQRMLAQIRMQEQFAMACQQQNAMAMYQQAAAQSLPQGKSTKGYFSPVPYWPGKLL